MTKLGNVCPAKPLTKDRFQVLLAQAWSRVVADMGTQSAMAAAMDLNDPKTIGRATGISNLPEAHTVFNSLCADQSALREILSYYGFELARVRAETANDLSTLSGLCETAAELSDALRDGVRVHPETLKIADKLRPLMPALVALVAEADALRAVA